MIHGLGAALFMVAALSADRTRAEHFDTDPGWDAHNNRLVDEPGRETIQHFSFSQTSHAGGAPREIGGTIQTAAERAYYAKKLPRSLTFNDRITASGKLAFAEGHATGPVIIGFFNSGNSFGWRTPNSLAIRIDGRGEVLHAHIEYCTAKWRAGAGMIAKLDPTTERFNAIEFPAAGVHTWSFDYDPAARDGSGAATFTFDGQTATMTLDGDHKRDGASFDRFGMFNVMKSSDNRSEVYLDDIVVNGETESFDVDPHWDGEGNQNEYRARIVRPWFDFGFSPTSFAGGDKGELGGVIFRGDYRYDRAKAYYGGPTGDLTLAKPLHASGRVCLMRGVSDSGVLIGWFHSTRSLEGGTDKSTIPQDFLGVFVEGPSREGFFFRPAYRVHGEDNGTSEGPHILPDSTSHKWTLDYTPGPEGRIMVTLDGENATLSIPAEYVAQGSAFDRFGIITTQIDGNMEIIYFDDLAYSVEQ